MSRALSALWILFLTPVLHGQDNAASLVPKAALSKAWAILTSALNAADVQEQLAAVSALTIADTPDALELFERVARTGTEPVRSTAMWSLPTTSSRDLLPLVADALRDPALSVQREAIHRLGFFRDGRAVQLLQDVIARNDSDTIEIVVGAARNLGSSGIRVLLVGADSVDTRVALASLRTIEVLVDPGFSSAASENLVALRGFRPEALFTNSLQHGSSDVRVLAALILARLDRDEGVRELIRAAESADRKFGTVMSAHRAMAALHYLGRTEYLAAALQSPEPRERSGAAFALRSFPHPSTTPLWADIWRGTSDLRYLAFDALASREGGPDLELLREGLLDSSPNIRLRAAEEILTLGFDAATLDIVEPLVERPETRLGALRLLKEKGELRRTARLARSLLPRALEEDAQARTRGYDPGYRFAVVHAFEVVHDQEAVPLLGALFGQDRNLTDRVVRALVAIGGDNAREALVRAMDAPAGSARALAAGGVIRVYSR